MGHYPLVNLIKCIHKWKYVRKYFKDKFEGVEFNNYYCPYRICVKCGVAQELICGDWSSLSPVKTKILKQIIVDKGDYFELIKKDNPDEIEINPAWMDGMERI